MGYLGLEHEKDRQSLQLNGRKTRLNEDKKSSLGEISEKSTFIHIYIQLPKNKIINVFLNVMFFRTE
jgi:hypothetical protein